MSTRATLLLFLVTLVLGSFIWFKERHLPTTDEYKRIRKRVFDGRAESIESIEVNLAGGTREVESWKARRGENGWVLESPVNDFGDPAVFSSMTMKFEFTDYERRFEGVDLGPFGLDRPVPRVTMVSGKKQIDFEIGDCDPLGKGCYVRRCDSGTVFLVSAAFGAAFTRPLAAVRDKSVFQASFQAASEIFIESEKMKLKFKKADGMWALTEPFRSFIEEGVLRNLIDSLNGTRITSYDAVPVPIGPGFVKCSVTEAGSEQKPSLDTPGARNSIILVRAGDEKWKASREGSPNSFGVEVPQGFEIPEEAEAFRLRTLFPAGIQGASRLAIASGDVSIEILLENGEWKLQVPIEGEANADLIASVLDRLSSTPIEYLTVRSSPPGIVPEEDKRNIVMKVAVTRGAKTFEVVFLSEKGVSSRLLAKRAGMEGLMEVPLSILSDIPVSPDEYRVPILAEVGKDSVISIRVETRDGVSEVFRAGLGWKAGGNGEAAVDYDAVDSILLAFSRFLAGMPGPMADDASLEHGPDLVITFGMAPGTWEGPRPELRFWNTGSKRLAHRPGDRRTYVIGDMVYELISSPIMKVSR